MAHFDILDHDLVFAIGGFDGKVPQDTIEVLDLTNGCWEPGPRMSSARRGFGVAAADGSIYVVGGHTEEEGCLSRVELLSLTFGDWRQGPPMPTKRSGLAVAEMGGRIFAVGGRGGGRVLAAVEAYDPGERRWSTWPSLPKARTSLAVAAWHGRLYAVGGDVGGGGAMLGGAVGGAQPINLLDILDSESRSWAQGAPMAVRRCDLGAAAASNRVCAIGGFGGRVEGGDYLSSMEIFDIQTGLWEAGPPMALSRAGVGVAVHGARILVLGGPFAGVGTTTLEMFDTEASSWGLGPAMPSRRWGLAVAVHLGSCEKLRQRGASAEVRATTALTRALSRALVEVAASDVCGEVLGALSQAISQCQGAGFSAPELEAARAAHEALRRKMAGREGAEAAVGGQRPTSVGLDAAIVAHT